MTFESLDLQIKYKTGHDDVLRDFYIPVLSYSIAYYRAVGYFSSSILVDYAKGLKSLVRNNGRMRLIISPFMVSSDMQAIAQGVTHEMLSDKMNSLFNEYLKSDEVTIASSQLLVMLMDKGFLDIKVAAPRNLKGMFHEKIGIFMDENGNKIAISGSNNETSQAVQFNHESFNVFCSWKDGQTEYVDSHVYDFDEYWSGRYEHIALIELQDAVDAQILQELRTDLSIDELFDKILSIGSIREDRPAQLDFKPYDYQLNAVEKWEKVHKGIFKFATGAGKTKTAILLMHRIMMKKRKNVFVIVVPDKTLVYQWSDELETYDLPVTQCFSDNPKWRVIVKDYIDMFEAREKRQEVFVVTNDTFFGDSFQFELKKLNNQFILIVDECHTWGTERILANLPDPDMRLGLSATPELHFSHSKTTRLLDYFGGIIAEYSLERAIQEKRLVPYEYHPLIVHLTSHEKEEYEKLTHKIVKLIGSDVDHMHDGYDKALEMLLFKRARIVYGAQEKIRVLGHIVEGLSDKGRLLIYCGPTSSYVEDLAGTGEVSKSQLIAVNKLLASKGLQFAQYTSQEDAFDRHSALQAFKNDSYSTLVAIKCLDEGINIPQIERAVILASSTNPREFIQRRGRILRHHPGKRKAEIYDFLVFDDDHPNLIKKEMNRFYEFARIALNEEELFNSYEIYIDQYLNDKGDCL
jgi:superfamily II DNA or RNA helicase